MKITFVVYGHPEPQGSTKAFIPKGWTRAIITSDNKTLKPWRQEVSRAAIEEMPKQCEGACEPISREIPVRVRFDFYLARPASLPKKFTWHTKKPDTSKLIRSAEDSLTGIIFEDDSQIVQEIATKNYGSPERVEITVESLEGEQRVFQPDTLDLFSQSDSSGAKTDCLVVR